MMWHKTFLLVAAAAFAVPVAAQLNESDTSKFQLRSSLTGNYQQGNVNILTIRSKLEFTFALAKNVVFKSQNNSLYQEFGGDKADNDLFSRNYIYYKPERRLYPFGIAYISSNYRRKINQRLFAGAGATVQAISTPLHVVKLAASAVYETTKFNGTSFNFDQYNGSNQINCWRGTLYAGGWNYLLYKHLRLYYDAFWQPVFNNKNNYRAQFDVGADLPVWAGLSFNVLYTFTHENVVISRIKPNDKILTFGIVYNLKIKH